MKPYEYKPPRVGNGDLRTPVHFYEYESEGPMPNPQRKRHLYTAWAKIDQVWLKDLELAKANGTTSDVTIMIRCAGSDYAPSNHHHVEIDADEYRGRTYNIKMVRPDLQRNDFITIVAGVAV
ncbi:head-tail adaptor protein [Bacillus sp. FSL W7-1360]